MKTTNRERVGALYDNYLYTSMDSDEFLDAVAKHMDKLEHKSEKRGARKVCQCCKPQPEPQRYTREEAEWLAVLLISSVTETLTQSHGEERRAAFEKARQNVIDAIAGQLKPEPQFDADIVKGLIGNLMGSVYYKATINDWLTESQKRAAEIVENDKRELYKELGIE